MLVICTKYVLGSWITANTRDGYSGRLVHYFLVRRTRKSDRKCSARFFLSGTACLVLTSGALVLSLFTCHGYEKNNLLPVV